jgi:hypothetical protein
MFGAELAEIDENLVRNELDPVTMGELANRRDEILKELGQRAKQGQNRFTNCFTEYLPGRRLRCDVPAAFHASPTPRLGKKEEETDTLKTTPRYAF